MIYRQTGTITVDDTIHCCLPTDATNSSWFIGNTHSVHCCGACDFMLKLIID